LSLVALRVVIVSTLVLSTGCGPAPPPTVVEKLDPVKEPHYLKTVEQLVAMNREAQAAYSGGDSDKAAKIMEKEKPLVSEVLAVPKPSLQAMEAASDLDQLYGTMLLKNRHYGWARILFQGNLARWKHWQPQTPESARRLKEAESGMAECDRHLVE
jgi:hypothetical protein